MAPAQQRSTMMKIPRPKVNVIELTMIGVLVAVLAYTAGVHRAERRLAPFLSRGVAELLQLAERYGPSRNSRYGEEWIVRDFFNDKRGGVFVDVGANHYRRDSNTYYLETQLGWSGVAIEPQVEFATDYAVHRPRTKFVPLFVSDVSSSQTVFYVGANNLVASFDRDVAESEGGGRAHPVAATTATLDDILEHEDLRAVDFLSIDIELHEPQALKGFSIDRFRPRLVAIESHLPVRQQILDYFADHRYVVIGKYLRADNDNLWFAPLNDAGLAAARSRAGDVAPVR
jgi:FkbM family methyltransferase